mmetsp:Transcript_16451/g.24880  ORF Transcript_16451/g.24880 Transcript_16451/m.24880 type:complete len:186 (-) Transcript_16451:184-741(-)
MSPHRQSEGNNVRFAAAAHTDNWGREEQHDTAADDPFRQQQQYDSGAANDHGHVFGSQYSSTNFAEVAAAAPAPDPEGQINWGIQTQPSNTSTVEPVYPHLDQHGRHFNQRMYQSIGDSFDDEQEVAENYIGEVDYSEHTRRANVDTFPVNNYDDGANKKCKAKVEEDGVINVHDDFSDMSLGDV